jgi:acyl carrier protein
MHADPQLELRQHIQALLAEVFAVPLQLVTPDLAFGDLPQWDSLGHMDLMMRLEEQFDAQIDTEAIAELVSVPAICAYLVEKGAGEWLA